MGAISDNISNVNTIGYKGSKVNFQTLVTKQVSLTQYSPGGVQSRPRQAVDAQGLLQATSSATDVAMSGAGMFVVNTVADPAASGSGMYAYTRAGSFKVNKEGYLQNVSGFFMQGWPLAPTNNNTDAKPTEVDIDGNTYMKAYKNTDGTWHYVNQNIINTEEVRPLNLKTIGGTADQTSQIKMGANLPSGDSVYDPASTTSTGYHQTSVLVYDSLGNTHNFNSDWTKTNANTWNVEVKSNFYSVAKALTDTSADATPTMKLYGSATGSTTTVTGIDGNDTVGFFSDAGVIAVTTGSVAATLVPAGAVVTISGATTSANNGDYVIGSTVATSVGITTAAPTSVTVIEDGNTHTYSATPTFTLATQALDLGETSTSYAVGDFIHVANSTSTSANTGYYKVSAVVTGATTVLTLAAADYIAIDTSPYQDQRGINPPTGAAVMNIYNSSDEVYASQARMDFTASSRADVLALDGKYFTMTVNGVSMQVEFSTDGSASGSADVMIDLTSAAYDTGSEVADLVAKALRNPRNWDSGTNGNLASDLVNLGSTIPLFRANGNSVEIIQQLNGPEIDFDLSNLDTGCTQYATHQWSSAIPSVDATTHTFTLEAINETDDAMIFNGDGTPQTINVDKISVAWANGAQSMTTVPNGTGADQRISWFLGNTNQADGMTQLGGNYQLAYLTQNGAKFGNFSGVSVSTDGVVTALFDNGVRRPVFQIPVATFTNSNGMESLTGNTWIETDVSGTYTLRVAGQAGSGQIQSASLEASTVDIGEEFTTMIVTQRAYSAAAKIITTADQMLDELVQIKR
jgi:flagellar hook protein FlgE